MTTYPEKILHSMKRWTVNEYHALRDRGILADGAPIELLDGFLMYKDRGESGVRSMSHSPGMPTAWSNSQAWIICS